MKKTRLIPIILSGLILTACGSSKYSEPSYNSISGAAMDSAPSYEYSESLYDNSDYSDYDSEESKSYDVNEINASNSSPESSASDTIRREMLVYSCNMSIDVLDFPTAVDSFKNDLSVYGGFIETENYSDGGSSSKWYYEDSEKWQSYTATVRIPCDNYEAFCTAAGELGDLRSKNASVKNLTNEFYDISTTLEVYEAKEKRYISLLAEVSEDEYAVAIERELTDIQIEIARLKSRMKTIKDDVAYSYVYLSINEVKEYHAEPIKTDTFLDRLGNTLSDSAEGFLIFLEDFLFVMIYLAPYLVIIAVIVVIIVKSGKKKKAKKAAAIAAVQEPTPADENTAAEKTE